MPEFQFYSAVTIRIDGGLGERFDAGELLPDGQWRKVGDDTHVAAGAYVVDHRVLKAAVEQSLGEGSDVLVGFAIRGEESRAVDAARRKAAG